MQCQNVASFFGPRKDSRLHDSLPFVPLGHADAVGKERQFIAIGLSNVHGRDEELRQPDVPLYAGRVVLIQHFPIVHDIFLVLPALHVAFAAVQHISSLLRWVAVGVHCWPTIPARDGDCLGRDLLHLSQVPEIVECFHQRQVCASVVHTLHESNRVIGTLRVQTEFRGAVGQRLLAGDDGQVDVVVEAISGRSAGYNWWCGRFFRTSGMHQRGRAS